MVFNFDVLKNTAKYGERKPKWTFQKALQVKIRYAHPPGLIRELKKSRAEMKTARKCTQRMFSSFFIINLHLIFFFKSIICASAFSGLK